MDFYRKAIKSLFFFLLVDFNMHVVIIFCYDLLQYTPSFLLNLVTFNCLVSSYLYHMLFDFLNLITFICFKFGYILDHI